MTQSAERQREKSGKSKIGEKRGYLNVFIPFLAFLASQFGRSDRSCASKVDPTNRWCLYTNHND